MKTVYTGTNSHITGQFTTGSLSELMRNKKILFISKNNDYILFRSDSYKIWKPSWSKGYNPTRYEKRCIEIHKTTL
jgi:hypothetical protein